MPPAKKPYRRVFRCSYVENGKRCRRSATGNPPLCQPHLIAMEERLKRATPGGGVQELFTRLFTGERLNKKVVREALEDAASWWDTVQQAKPEPKPFAGAAGESFESWWARVKQATGMHGSGASGRVHDPATEIRAAQVKARTVLGFTPTEPISSDILKKRHRELARAHHPDRGGSVAKMQEINAAVDILMQAGVT